MSKSNRFRADLRLLGRAIGPDLDSALAAVRLRVARGAIPRLQPRPSTLVGAGMMLLALGLVSPAGSASRALVAPGNQGPAGSAPAAQLDSASRGSAVRLPGVPMCDRASLALLSAADTGGGMTELWLTMRNLDSRVCQVPVDRCASAATVEDASGSLVYSTADQRNGLCGGGVAADRPGDALRYVALGAGATASISFQWDRGGSALPGNYRVVGSWAGFDVAPAPADIQLAAFHIDAPPTAFRVR